MAKKFLEIYGSNKEYLSVTLNEILMCIENREELWWGILYLEAIFKPNVMDSVLELESTINNSSQPGVLSWVEMQTIEQKFEQIVEILIIADHSIDNIRSYTVENEMQEHCEFVIKLVDSSYWLLVTANLNSIEAARQYLPGTNEVTY